MTLAELMARHREYTSDKVGPHYLLSSDLLRQYLNEAEREAVIRARLIHESADPDICEIDVAAGTSIYPLHAALYELDHVSFVPTDETLRYPVRLVSQEWLDARRPDWRDDTGRPEFAIQGDKTLRLIPRPDAPGVIHLEGYRTPKALMAADTDEPEINPIHHVHLVEWSQFLFYSTQDSEMYDPARAASAADAFEARFGRAPNADLRRQSREDVPHAVQAFMP